MSVKVNLNAYFERIGFAGSIAPTLQTLEQLHGLHPATIAFENLNPLLGLPVLLDQASLEQKLLAEHRGGYCFEHNLMLMRVLQELDFTVRSHAGRVVWNNHGAMDRPPTHMLLVVDIAGTSYLSDVGLGGLTLTGPIKLRADVEQTTPHDTYRLTGGEPDWHLQIKLNEQWETLYVFTLDPFGEADYEAPNRFVSTDPSSKFTRELGAAISPPGQRITLSGSHLTTRATGQDPVRRTIGSVEELREVLLGTFGIGLPPAELLDPVLERFIARPADQS